MKDFKTSEEIVNHVSEAIHEVTGISFAEFTERIKKMEYVYARMMFTHNCFNLGMNIREISKYLFRDRVTIIHSLKKFDDEYRYNKQFRMMADRVKELINRYDSY